MIILRLLNETFCNHQFNWLYIHFYNFQTRSKLCELKTPQSYKYHKLQHIIDSFVKDPFSCSQSSLGANHCWWMFNNRAVFIALLENQILGKPNRNTLTIYVDVYSARRKATENFHKKNRFPLLFITLIYNEQTAGSLGIT